MDHVKPSLPLKAEQKKEQIKKAIIEKVNCPHIATLKCNVDLTKDICNYVENSSQNLKKYKIDKKELVLDILKTLFNNCFSDDEYKFILNHIEQLHRDGGIKKISQLYIKAYKLGEFILKKVL